MREIYNNYLHNSEIFATFAVVLSVNQFNSIHNFIIFRYEKDCHILIGIAIE